MDSLKWKYYAKILGIVCIFLVLILLIIIPFTFKWEFNCVATLMCLGAASSIIASLIFTFFTFHFHNQDQDEFIDKLSSKINDLNNIVNKGLRYFYVNRKDSIKMQEQMLKEGQNIYIFATTFHSLFSYRTDACEIICRNNQNKYNLLIVDPAVYVNNNIYINDNNNNKLKESVRNLKKCLLQNAISQNKVDWIKFFLIKKLPEFFLIENEHQILISFYDYEKGGTQPVFVFSNNSQNNKAYLNYKNQIKDLLCHAKEYNIENIFEIF
jgi:hypothetical protein